MGDCTIHEFALRRDDGWQLTDAILDALSSELDCLFLCTPNNPTGLLPDNRLLREIAARCELLGINLILDEAFIDFIAGEQGLFRCFWITRIFGCCALSPSSMRYRGCVGVSGQQ